MFQIKFGGTLPKAFKVCFFYHLQPGFVLVAYDDLVVFLSWPAGHLHFSLDSAIWPTRH